MIAALLLLQIGSQLQLPADTAYLIDAGKSKIGESREIRAWNDPKTKILWGGHVKDSGKVSIELEVDQPAPTARYRLTVVGSGGGLVYLAKGPKPEFENVMIAPKGWFQLTLQGVGPNGTEFGTLKALTINGDAVKGAQFNLQRRRNAASVHLRYDVPPEAEVEWMYNEVTAKADPVHTFFVACGFSRGYFGIQVNGPQERRVVFSVWDSGLKNVDREKVAEDDQVKLLKKGDDVVTESFGNEGTGGHSHLVTRWKTTKTQQFLVHAEKDGDGTVYTGYYYLPEKSKWTLIASFRAPKDRLLLQKTYSFVENFWGDTGYLKRAAEFGPAWIRVKGSDTWEQVTTARFTHDKTGGNDRFDYDLVAKHGHFLLQTGGFEGSSPASGFTVTVPLAKPPKIDLDKLSG